MVHRTSSVQQIETSDDDLPLSNAKKAISTTDLSVQQQRNKKQVPRRNSLRLSIDHQNFHLNKVNVPPITPTKNKKHSAEKQRLKTTKNTETVDSDSVSDKIVTTINKPPPSTTTTTTGKSKSSTTQQNNEVTVKLKRNDCAQLNKNDKTKVEVDNSQSSKAINKQNDSLGAHEIGQKQSIHDRDQEEDDSNSTGIICRLPLERLSGIIDTLTRIDNSSSSNSSQQSSANNAGNRTLCLYCDRSFSSQKLLAKHTERIHQAAEGRRLSARKPNTSSLLYPGCSHCNNGKTTSLPVDELPALFEHLVDIHFDKYFACKLCIIRFTNKENLQQHTDDAHAVANNIAAAIDTTPFKQPSKTPIYDKRKKKSLKVSVSSDEILSTNDDQNASKSINDDSVGISSADDSVDTSLDTEVEKISSSTNSESKLSLRSSRRQQEAKSNSSNNDLPPPKTSTPLLRKKQILSNEQTPPLLSRLGIAQNRSPRTRRGLKTSRNNDSESYRSDTPTGGGGGGGAGSSASSTTSSSGATPRSRNKNSRSNSATNVSATITSADGVLVDLGQSPIGINNTQRTTIGGGGGGGASKVSAADTPNGSFDENFYESVCTNVRLNLSCHLDGKRECGPTSPGPLAAVVTAIVPAVSATLVKTPVITDPELHEATALATVTAFPTLLTAHQYGVEPHMGKIKKPITKNSWKWKWDSAKKYKWFNEGGKMVKKIKPPAGGLRDLSRLDMWTQLSMRMRHEQQQRLQIDAAINDAPSEQNLRQIDASKLEKQKLIDQLSSILDRRVLPQINLEQNDQRIIKFEQIEQQEELSNDIVTKSSPNTRDDTDAPDDLLSILKLNRVQKTTTSNTSVANAQTTNTNANTGVILSGEWARPRCYICYGCGAKFETIKNLEDHQILRHPHVYTTHYEIVGKELIEGNLFRHFYIPSSALHQHTEYKQRQANAAIVASTSVAATTEHRRDLVEDSMDSVTSCSASISKSDSFDMDTNSRNSKESSNTVMTTMSAPVSATTTTTTFGMVVDATTSTNYSSSSSISAQIRRSCTKCKRLCSGRLDLYRHMLDCSGDYAWFLAKKRHNIKYRYFGSRKRKVNRTNYAHRRPAVRPKKEESSGETTPRTKEPQTPKPRPSDAESIQRMLANLPAKRACRQIFPNLVQKRTRKLIATANTAAALRHKQQILAKQTNQSNTNRSTRSYKYVTASTNSVISKNLNMRKKLMKQQQQQATPSTSSSTSTSTSASPSPGVAAKSRVSAEQRKTRSSLNQNDNSTTETQSNPEKNNDFIKTLRSKTRRVVSKIKSSFRRPLTRTRIIQTRVNSNQEEEKPTTLINENIEVDKPLTKNDSPKTTTNASRSTTIIRRALSFRRSRRKIQETTKSSQVTNEDKVANDDDEKIAAEDIKETDLNNDNKAKTSSKKVKGKTFKKFFKTIGKNCHKKSDTTTPDKDLVQPYVRVTDVIKQKSFLSDMSKTDNVHGEKLTDQLKCGDATNVTKEVPSSNKNNVTDNDAAAAAAETESPPTLDTNKIEVISPQPQPSSLSDRLLHEDDTLSNTSETSNTASVPQTPSSPTIIMKTPPSAKRKPRKLNDCIAMLTGKLQEKLGVPFLENDCNVLMQSSVRSVHQAVMEDDDDDNEAAAETLTTTIITPADNSVENTPKKRRGRKPKNLVMVQQRPIFQSDIPSSSADIQLSAQNMPITSIPSICDGIKSNLTKKSAANFLHLYNNYDNDDNDYDYDDNIMEQEQPINLVVPKERHGRASSSWTNTHVVLSSKPTILPVNDNHNTFSKKIGIEFNKFSTIQIPETTTFSSPYLHSPPANLRSPTEDITAAAMRSTTSELRKLRKTKSARCTSPSNSIFTIDKLLKPSPPVSNVVIDGTIGTLDLSTHHFGYKLTSPQLYSKQTIIASSGHMNMSLNQQPNAMPSTASTSQKTTRKETSSEILTRIINEVAMGPRDDDVVVVTDDVVVPPPPPKCNISNSTTDNNYVQKQPQIAVPHLITKVTKLSEEIRVQDSIIAKSINAKNILSIAPISFVESKSAKKLSKDTVNPRVIPLRTEVSAVLPPKRDISAAIIVPDHPENLSITNKSQPDKMPELETTSKELSNTIPQLNKDLLTEDKIETEISTTKPKPVKKQQRGKKKTEITSEPQTIIVQNSAKDLPEDLSEPKPIVSEQKSTETETISAESKTDETSNISVDKPVSLVENLQKKVNARKQQNPLPVTEKLPEVTVSIKESIDSNPPPQDLCKKTTEPVEPKKISNQNQPSTVSGLENDQETGKSIVPEIDVSEKSTETIENQSKSPNRKTLNRKSKAKSSQAEKISTETSESVESIQKNITDIKETTLIQSDGVLTTSEISSKDKPKVSPAKTKPLPSESKNLEPLDNNDDDDTNDDNIVLADIQKKNSENADKSNDKKTKVAATTVSQSPSKTKPVKKYLRTTKSSISDAKQMDSSVETNSNDVVLEIKSIPKKDSGRKTKPSIGNEPVTESPSKTKSTRKLNSSKLEDYDEKANVQETKEIEPEGKSHPENKQLKSDIKIVDSSDETIHNDAISEDKPIPKKVVENSNKLEKSSTLDATISTTPSKAKKPPRTSTVKDTMFDSSDDELLPWDPEIGFVNRANPVDKPTEEPTNDLQEETTKTTDTTDTTAVPPVTKQRKRRKNELAKIIADQLLESFKEVDQSRIEELKFLHNLSIDNNSTTADDLLISATLSATPPPKRKTAANIASDALVDLDTSFEEVDSESEAEIAKGNSGKLTARKHNEPTNNVSTSKSIIKSKAAKKMVIDDKKVSKSDADLTTKRKLTATQLNLMKKQRRGIVAEKNNAKNLLSDAENTDNDKVVISKKVVGKKLRRTIGNADKEKCVVSDATTSCDEVESNVKKLRRTTVEKKPITSDTNDSVKTNNTKKQPQAIDAEKDGDNVLDSLKDIELQPPVPIPKSATKGRRHTICGKNPISNMDTTFTENISITTDKNAFQPKSSTTKEKRKINEKDTETENKLESESTTTNIQQSDRDSILLDDKLLKAKIVVSTIKLAPVKPIILDAKTTVPSVEVAPTVSSVSPNSDNKNPPILGGGAGTSIKSQHGKIMKKGRGGKQRSPKKSQQVSPIARTKSNVNDLVAQIINDFTTSTIDSPRKESPTVVFGELTKTNLDLLNRTARNNELFNSLKYSTSKTDMEKLPEIGIATKQNHRPSYDHALMGRPKAVENLMQMDRLSAACMKSPMRAPFMSPRWEPGETDRFDTATASAAAAAAAKLLMPPPQTSSTSATITNDALIKEPVLQKLWQPAKSSNPLDESSSSSSLTPTIPTIIENSLFQNVKEKTKKLFGKISKRKSKKSDSNKRISPTHTKQSTMQPKRPLLRPSILSTANVFNVSAVAAATATTAVTGSTSLTAGTTTATNSDILDTCIKKLETNNLFLPKSVHFTENLTTNIFVKDHPKTTSAESESAKDGNLFEKSSPATTAADSPFKLFAKDVTVPSTKKVSFPETETAKPPKVIAKKISQRRQTTTSRRLIKESLPKQLTPPPPPSTPLDSLNTAFIQKRPQPTNRPIKTTTPMLTTNQPINKLSSIPSHIFTDARCMSPSGGSSSSSSSGDTFLSQILDKIRAVNRDQHSESEEDLCLAAIAKSLNNKMNSNSDEFSNELDSPPAESANAARPSFAINERPKTPSLVVNNENDSPTLIPKTNTAETTPIDNPALPTTIDRSEIDPDENTNTDLIDMDLEDCASVYTSFSIDTSFTAGGTAVRRKKRRTRKSIIYRKAKKSDVFLSPGDGHLCDICNKTFRSLGGLHSHKMTLSHISKLSEREFLQQTQANLNAEAESNEGSEFVLPPPPPTRSPLTTILPPPLPLPLPKQMPIATEENSNVRPIESIEASVPIEDTTAPSNVIDVAAHEPSAASSPASVKSAAIVSPIRVPQSPSAALSPHQQSIPSSYMCQSGIEPISSPEQIDFSYDRYALPSTRPIVVPAATTTSIDNNSRLALSQEERLFYECCSMLKGSDRSVIPSSALGVASSSPIAKLVYPSGGVRMTPLDDEQHVKTKPVTPKSNEQYSSYLHPVEHAKGIAKIDINQFSDISSDSNPAYSCPQIPSQSDTGFANEPLSHVQTQPSASASSSLLNIVVGSKNQSLDQQQLQHDQRRNYTASLIGRGFTGAFADVGDHHNFMSAHTRDHDNDNDNYLPTIMKQRSPMYGQRYGSYLSPTNITSPEQHRHRLLTNIGSLDTNSIAAAGGADGKNESTGSPMDSPLHSTSSQSSTFTVSKPRTKAAMKGYENFKVSIPTTGLDMQQALNRSPNPTGCKLAALADIALGNDVPHAVGLMRSPSTSALSISGGGDLSTKIQTPSPSPPSTPTPPPLIPPPEEPLSSASSLDNESTEEKDTSPFIINESDDKFKQKSIDQVPTITTTATATATVVGSKKLMAKNKKETTGNSLGFKQKKKVPKSRQPIEKPTLEQRDIYDFEDSHDDSMDVPIVALSHSRTKISGPELTAAIQSITQRTDDLAEENDQVPNEIDDSPIPVTAQQTSSNGNEDVNTVANSPASSYSDRDDFNYDSVSESESTASSEAKPEPSTSRPASRISNRSAKSINNLQKKCLIMGRIFKTAKKTEVASVAEKPAVREQGVVVKKPIPKQELDKLFDSLRGNSCAASGGTSAAASVTNLPSKKQSKSLANENKSAAAKTSEQNASSSSSATKTAAATLKQSSVKKDDKAAKRDAARRSRKPREVANMEAEWGMSMEQIIDLIGVGQRKTQRRCAANKQRTFAETWSSDEYEEFHSTKDIIALIQEAEVKARRARSRSAKNSKKLSDNQSKADDDDADNDNDANNDDADASTNIENNEKSRNVPPTNVEMENKKMSANKVPTISDSDPRRKSNTLYNFKENNKPEKDKENKHAPPAAAQTTVQSTGIQSKDDSMVERKKKAIRDENSSGEMLSSSSTAECGPNSTGATTTTGGNKKQHLPQSTTKPKKSTTFSGVADSDDTDIDSEWSKSVKRSKIKNRRRTIAFHEDETKIQTNTAKSKRNKTPPPPSSRKFDATSKMSSASSSSHHHHHHHPQQQQQQRNSLICVGTTHKSSATTKSTGGDHHKPMSRRKRMASEMLYYWSSSSDEEFGRIKPRENYDDDNLEQHGWIVGDSHKKLVTLLAHAKGKKIEDCGVKEAIHKKKS